MNNIKSITPQLTEIKNYTPALKIGDKYFVNGIGGNYIPGSPSNSIDFYKCNSVDSTNQTWTGYKAVLTDGVYIFESTVTNGLTYSVITPKVQKVYTDGALVEAKLYTGIPDDMVLYIPLSDSLATTAETGQTLDFSGSGFSFSTVNGIPCCYFSGNGYVNVGTDNLPNGNFTISYWVKYSGSEWGIIYTQPDINTGADSTSLNFGKYTEWGAGASTTTTLWHHFAVTYNNDAVAVYLDGTLADSDTQNLYVSASSCRLGCHITSSNSYTFVGYLAGLRVYDRALTATEITALAAEFTPTQS